MTRRAPKRARCEVQDAFGAVDVLINNAAIPRRRKVTYLSVAEFQATMRVNLESPVRMTLALLPGMLERQRGSIVNVSSMGGRIGIAHETAYCASKFGLCGWSEALALDLWDTPLEVRLIQPGPIDTEIWDQPDNEPALYDGPLEPASTVAEGIIAAIEGEGFEHYIPDLKGIVEFKTSRHRRVPGRLRRRDAARGRGRRAMKALVFGVTPEAVEPPPTDAPRLLQNLATTPMALQDVDPSTAVRAGLDRAADPDDRHLRIRRQAGAARLRLRRRVTTR